MDQLILINSIKHKEKLIVEYDDKTYFGCNQSWFSDKTKIAGGCGPVCATNLLNYYGLIDNLNNENLASQLDTMYSYIKPTEIQRLIPPFLKKQKFIPPSLGVRNLNRFQSKFIKMADQEYPNRQLRIKEFRMTRIDDDNKNLCLEFISDALNANKPLCFLNTFRHSNFYVSKNLPTGKHCIVESVEELKRLKLANFQTHWVLVTGLYQSLKTKEYYLECSTWGKLAYFKLSDFYTKQNLQNYIFTSGMLRIEL